MPGAGDDVHASRLSCLMHQLQIPVNAVRRVLNNRRTAKRLELLHILQDSPVSVVILKVDVVLAPVRILPDESRVLKVNFLIVAGEEARELLRRLAVKLVEVEGEVLVGQGHAELVGRDFT